MTVIFLVDVDKALPSPEEWPSVWAEQSAWTKAQDDLQKEKVGVLRECVGPTSFLLTDRMAYVYSCKCVGFVQRLQDALFLSWGIPFCPCREKHIGSEP